MADQRVTVDCPEEVLISLKEDRESFARELRTLAAVKLYELGKLSSGRAAQLAGMGRVQFIMALPRYRVSALDITAREIEDDAGRA